MARKTPVEALDILRKNIKMYAPEFDSSNGDTNYATLLDDHLDSLDEVELVMALEDDLEIEVSDETVNSWKDKTLAQVAEDLTSLQAGAFA